MPSAHTLPIAAVDGSPQKVDQNVASSTNVSSRGSWEAESFSPLPSGSWTRRSPAGGAGVTRDTTAAVLQDLLNHVTLRRLDKRNGCPCPARRGQRVCHCLAACLSFAKLRVGKQVCMLSGGMRPSSALCFRRRDTPRSSLSFGSDPAWHHESYGPLGCRWDRAVDAHQHVFVTGPGPRTRPRPVNGAAYQPTTDGILMDTFFRCTSFFVDSRMDPPSGKGWIPRWPP